MLLNIQPQATVWESELLKFMVQQSGASRVDVGQCISKFTSMDALLCCPCKEEDRNCNQFQCCCAGVAKVLVRGRVLREPICAETAEEGHQSLARRPWIGKCTVRGSRKTPTPSPSPSDTLQGLGKVTLQG